MLPGELPAADRHYLEMLRLSATVLTLVRRAWATVNPDQIVETWDRALAGILGDFVTLQATAAAVSSAMVGEALRQQGIRSTPEARFRPESMAGWASDGRPLESLLFRPAGVALDLIDAGTAPPDALEAGRASVERIARTQIADAGRVAAGVEVTTRPRTGWVRMLTPPSCERCLILAGRFYRWSDGFDRHPNDDCVSIPSAETRADDVRTDPDAYLKTLTPAEQDRLLGKANAQAWRDGADLNQLVNAKRGMATTVDGVKVTTEGTTGRGFAGRRLRGEQRLVPESIYKMAADREDALRLLHQHGYLVGNPARAGRLPRRPAPQPTQAAASTATQRRAPTISGPRIGDLVPDRDFVPADRQKVIAAAVRDRMNREYGDHGLRLDVSHVTPEAGKLSVGGNILDRDGNVAGEAWRVFHRDPDGTVWAQHDYLELKPNYQGQGFAKAFNDDLYDWYRQSGVQYVKTHANIDVGGYTWARQGFDFATKLSAEDVMYRLRLQLKDVDVDSAEARAARGLLDRAARHPFGSDGYPSAYEVSQLGRVRGATTWLGKRAMLGSSWDGVRWL
jgi:GNAT superfamily N-acetyltransferase